jgi:hypothetical protein
VQSAKKECVTDISHTVLLNVAVKCETLFFYFYLVSISTDSTLQRREIFSPCYLLPH